MILLVAHDAGGAEVVSSWALRHRDEGLRFLLDGPAVEIFRRKLGWNLPFGFPDRTGLVLTGTSATSDLESGARRMAKDRGVPAVAWLDHWKNYAARFDGLPDEVWVTDQWAAALAREELPGAKVLVKGNPYMEDVLAEIRALSSQLRPQGDAERVLYVSEPGREDAFETWVLRSAPRRMSLRERPHPSVASPEQGLAEDVAWADLVVGFDSMALAVAVRAGKRTTSLLSPEEPLTIPYPGVERLYERRFAAVR